MQLSQLGAKNSVLMLDRLEEEGHYHEWVLRLSPFVKDENSYDRAKRLMQHDDRSVRIWAERLMDDVLPD